MWPGWLEPQPLSVHLPPPCLGHWPHVSLSHCLYNWHGPGPGHILSPPRLPPPRHAALSSQAPLVTKSKPRASQSPAQAVRGAQSTVHLCAALEQHWATEETSSPGSGSANASRARPFNVAATRLLQKLSDVCRIRESRGRGFRLRV